MTDIEDDKVVPFVKAGTGAACPNCGRARVQEWRPFCSKRCADIDLGHWFNESYAVPSSSPHGDDDD